MFYSATSVNLTSIQCNINSNNAGNSGGIIWAHSNATVLFSNSTIFENTATSDGAVIYAGLSSILTVTEGSFIFRNAAGFGSGGVVFAG